MTYEYEAKTEKEAIELAAAELGLERDQFDVEILEAQKNAVITHGRVHHSIYLTVQTVTTDLAESVVDHSLLHTAPPLISVGFVYI